MLLGKFFQNIEKKYKNFFFSGISFDTKSIKKNNIFFAIKGNSVDGNKFIPKAIKKGSKIILIQFILIFPSHHHPTSSFLAVALVPIILNVFVEYRAGILWANTKIQIVPCTVANLMINLDDDDIESS